MEQDEVMTPVEAEVRLRSLRRRLDFITAALIKAGREDLAALVSGQAYAAEEYDMPLVGLCSYCRDMQPLYLHKGEPSCWECMQEEE